MQTIAFHTLDEFIDEVRARHHDLEPGGPQAKKRTIRIAMRRGNDETLTFQRYYITVSVATTLGETLVWQAFLASAFVKQEGFESGMRRAEVELRRHIVLEMTPGIYKDRYEFRSGFPAEANLSYAGELPDMMSQIVQQCLEDGFLEQMEADENNDCPSPDPDSSPSSDK